MVNPLVMQSLLQTFFNVCVKYITPIIMILILAGQLDSFFGLGWFS